MSKQFDTYFVGEITSKQNRLSESLTGRTVHMRRSSSITVGVSLSPLFLRKEIEKKLKLNINVRASNANVLNNQRDTNLPIQ